MGSLSDQRSTNRASSDGSPVPGFGARGAQREIRRGPFSISMTSATNLLWTLSPPIAPVRRTISETAPSLSAELSLSSLDRVGSNRSHTSIPAGVRPFRLHAFSCWRRSFLSWTIGSVPPFLLFIRNVCRQTLTVLKREDGDRDISAPATAIHRFRACTIPFSA